MSAQPVAEAPGRVRRWVLAARPRTLPAAAVPVVVGASAIRPASINWITSLLCMVVALALQIGTNYANDYSDGIRGTDDDRVGPFRLTASKLVAPSSVKNAAFVCFAVAGVAGLALAALVTWWFVPVGITAVAAGWFYTGGPRPYGYMGLGEVFVFVYFGLVATIGTAYSQHGQWNANACWLGAAMGAASCTLLEANNMRDIDGDRASGKRTLAARLGRERSGFLYALFVSAVCWLTAIGVSRSYVVFVYVGALFSLYWPALRLAYSDKRGRDLLALLVMSARFQMVVGVFATTALWLTYR